MTLQLPGTEVTLRTWLRVLPGRRYVGVADWRGKKVLAKLLVGRKAKQQYQSERAGALMLVEGGVATPVLLTAGYDPGAGGWLLYDYLDRAVSLAAAWCDVARQPLLSARQREVVEQALEILATLHQKGLWQQDLHLDNLLCRDGRVYVVDAGSVRTESPGQPLSRGRALENLGIFFAQLPAAIDPFADELLEHYRRGNNAYPCTFADVRPYAERVRRWRLRDYLRKTGRDCSLFAVASGARRLMAVRRDEADFLRPLLEEPDRYLESAAVYKTGGSSTVGRVELTGRPLLVKRYNIKGLGHWLRRCWRPSRAWHSWREGNRLLFLGIPTPKPLAVIEYRNFWLRNRACLVVEHLERIDILACFRPFVESSPPPEQLQALDILFAALLRERISHGDMKGHNLIWHDGQWALIDLDAMRQHRSWRGFSRAYARDRARFLNNWPTDSALYRLLDQRLPRVLGTPT